MKKFLTTLFAIIMSAVMLMFVGCSEAGESIYSGNYTEANGETLYESVETLGSGSNFTPTEDKNAGLSIKVSIKSTTKSDSTITHTEPNMVEKYSSSQSLNMSLSGKFVTTLEDTGVTPLADLDVALKSSFNENMPEETIKTSTDINANLLLKNDGLFIETSQSDTINGETVTNSAKTQMTLDQLQMMISNMLSQIMGNMQGSMPNVNEMSKQEIVSTIDNLTQNAGIRVALDTSKGTKIKIDLSDKDKFIAFINSSSGVPTEIEVDIDLKKCELYLIFDEDGNFSAFKFAFSYDSSSTQTEVESDYTSVYNNDASISISAEIKFYDGDVSLPEIDPDDYAEFVA